MPCHEQESLSWYIHPKGPLNLENTQELQVCTDVSSRSPITQTKSKLRALAIASMLPACCVNAAHCNWRSTLILVYQKCESLYPQPDSEVIFIASLARIHVH